MSFNLKKISDAPSAEVEVKDPETNAPLGVFFTLAGPEHPKRKQMDFARQRNARARFQKTNKLMNDPEEDDQEAREMLAACTLGWRGYVDDEGKDIPYSPAAAIALVNDPDMGWLRVQLATALAERERFIKRFVPA